MLIIINFTPRVGWLGARNRSSSVPFDVYREGYHLYKIFKSHRHNADNSVCTTPIFCTK
jgi:hypothetical protein